MADPRAPSTPQEERAALYAAMQRRERAAKFLDDAAKQWFAADAPEPAPDTTFADLVREHSPEPMAAAYLWMIRQSRRGALLRLEPKREASLWRSLRRGGFITLRKDPDGVIGICITRKGRVALALKRAAQLTKNVRRWNDWRRRILGLPSAAELRAQVDAILDAAADCLDQMRPYEVSMGLFGSAPWLLTRKQLDKLEAVLARSPETAA